jgi:hypothetical protein
MAKFMRKIDKKKTKSSWQRSCAKTKKIKKKTGGEPVWQSSCAKICPRRPAWKKICREKNTRAD